MELDIFKYLPDNDLGRFLDESAGSYIEHAEKCKLILPNEEKLARRHCSENVLTSKWGFLSKHPGEYDFKRKNLMISGKYKKSIVHPGEKRTERSIISKTTAFHEIGHIFQTNDSSLINTFENTDFLYDEAVNTLAEIMVSLSHFRNGGQQGVLDAKLEFCCDDVNKNTSINNLRRWLTTNLNLVLENKELDYVYSVYYSKYFADTFRVIKTFDLSIKDAFRNTTVLQNRMDDLAKEYNHMFNGRSFKCLLDSIGTPDFDRKAQHLAPLTLGDCKKYVKEINLCQ